MRSSSFELLLACMLFASQSVRATAPVVQGNAPGASAVCMLLDTTDTTAQGTVKISSTSNGTGANVDVSFSGLPTAGGPFAYHIGELPVPLSLDCQATGEHLDPYHEGSKHCDSAQPQLCQVGDLAGKHGDINGTTFSASYIDLYLSLQPETPAFIGNRSLVLHFMNLTRFACGNCTMAGLDSTPVALTIVTSAAAIVGAPSVGPAAQSTSCQAVVTALAQTVTTLTVDSTPVAASTISATQTLTSYVVAPHSASPPSQINTSTTLTASVLAPGFSFQPQTSTSTVTATVMSMIIIIPQHASTQVIQGNATLTRGTNQTVLETITQPYTITGTSTVLMTLMQTSTEVLTVQTSLTQTTTIPAATVGTQGLGPAAAALLATQTVYTTILSTSTLAFGGTVPSMMITAAPTVQATTFSVSTSGNLLSSIRTFLFGTDPPLIVVPTTITLTVSQTPGPDLISQVISLASIAPIASVAQVINVVSVAPTAISSVGKLLTSVTVVSSIVSDVVSTLTDNGVVSLVTQQFTVLPTVNLASTKILNLGLPIIATNALSVTQALSATSVVQSPIPTVTVQRWYGTAPPSPDWSGQCALAIAIAALTIFFSSAWTLF